MKKKTTKEKNKSKPTPSHDFNDPIDLAEFKRWAEREHQAHAKFLAQLKKKPPKQLDKITKDIHNEIFANEIDCIKCANCCIDLGPLWIESDIERVAHHLHMKVADFEAAYLHVDEDGDKVFKAMPCPFLDADNLCSIYEVRPKACREYPHTDRRRITQINHLTLKNTLYCPACYLFVEKLRAELEQ